LQHDDHEFGNNLHVWNGHPATICITVFR
jgi:hypothetical protein